MKTFNALQMVILLMGSPTLLSWLSSATFTGATALFWVGIIGTAALAIWNTILIRVGIDGL